MKAKFKPKRIRELRESYQYTLEEFAKNIDVTKQAVAMWESGETTPSMKNITKMCNIYGVKPGYFWS